MPPPDRLAEFTKDQLTHVRSLDFARWVAAVAHTGHAGPAAAAKFYLEHWPRSVSIEKFELIVPAGIVANEVTSPSSNASVIAARSASPSRVNTPTLRTYSKCGTFAAWNRRSARS